MPKHKPLFVNRDARKSIAKVAMQNELVSSLFNTQELRRLVEQLVAASSEIAGHPTVVSEVERVLHNQLVAAEISLGKTALLTSGEPVRQVLGSYFGYEDCVEYLHEDHWQAIHHIVGVSLLSMLRERIEQQRSRAQYLADQAEQLEAQRAQDAVRLLAACVQAAKSNPEVWNARKSLLDQGKTGYLLDLVAEWDANVVVNLDQLLTRAPIAEVQDYLDRLGDARSEVGGSKYDPKFFSYVERVVWVMRVRRLGYQLRYGSARKRLEPTDRSNQYAYVYSYPTNFVPSDGDEAKEAVAYETNRPIS